MSKKVTIGFDPGASGGVALFEGGTLIEVFTLGTETETLDYLRSLAERYEAPVAVLEEVGGFIGRPQSGSHMFKFGQSYGFLRGAIMAFGLPLRTVRPQEWQRGLPGLTKLKGSARKRGLKDLAAQRFPAAKPTLKTCDAILIGDYGRHLH